MYRKCKFFTKFTKYPHGYVGLRDSVFDVLFIDFTLPLHSQKFSVWDTKNRQQLNATFKLDQLRSFKHPKRPGSKIYMLSTNLGKHWS